MYYIHHNNIIYYTYCWFSYYLWSIALPIYKAGLPTYDLSQDEQANISPAGLTTNKLLYKRVITKVYTHYAIPLEISENIRTSFRSKLWRMGLKFCKLGSTSREIQLNNWKEWKAATWNFVVNDVEVNRQVLSRKRKAEELETETLKRKRCEEEIKTLQAKLQEQASIITQSSQKNYIRKPLSDCTRQQQYKIL